MGFQATPFIAGCTDQLKLYDVLQKKEEQKSKDAGENYCRFVLIFIDVRYRDKTLSWLSE